MDGYQKNSHAVYDIKYHVIWVTKYRYKVLRGHIAVRTRELIRQGCEARGITILQTTFTYPPALAGGRLIALPLQGEPRKYGNSVFVDENLQPYPNQWLYLSTVKKVRKKDIDSIVGHNHGFISVKESPGPVEKMPEKVSILTKDGIYIPKRGLPQHFIQELAQLSKFSNPAFYKAEKKRLSTKEIPRIIDRSENRSQPDFTERMHGRS